MQFATLCVVKRTRSVQKGMRRRAPHDSRACTGTFVSKLPTVIARSVTDRQNARLIRPDKRVEIHHFFRCFQLDLFLDGGFGQGFEVCLFFGAQRVGAEVFGVDLALAQENAVKPSPCAFMLASTWADGVSAVSSILACCTAIDLRCSSVP